MYYHWADDRSFHSLCAARGERQCRVLENRLDAGARRE
jgi:hypothetical protein